MLSAAPTATATTSPSERFRLTPRQVQALELLEGPAPRILLYGGSSSGKTRAIVEWLVRMCLHFPGLRVLILRHRRAHAQASVWRQTLKGEVLSTYDRRCFTLNASELIVSFANGSEIAVDGTEDQARLEKLLGRGVGAAYLNEASQISYQALTIVSTRLRQQVPGWINKLVCDQNPPAPSHWTHRVFIDHVEPRDGRQLDPARYVSLLLNPEHNLEHLPAGYLEELAELPADERARFLHGRWLKPRGAIFPEYSEALLVDDDPECERYVVGLDMVTYAAVLIGFERYRRGSRIRRRAWVLDEWGAEGALAHEANTAIRKRWSHHRYVAYIDHNLGKAGTREIDRSRLARKGQGSLEASIAMVQRMMHLDELRIHRRCRRLCYELENYHRDDNGEVVEVDDHFIAALRYAVYSATRRAPIEVD